MKFPMPPEVRLMHHHQVWKVHFERRLRSRQVEFGQPTTRLEPHLVLLVDPEKFGWRAGKWGFWRSKLLIGSIWERDEDAIWADLLKLRYQDPPYAKNYTSNLRMHRGDYIYWEHPVDWKIL